ncbi:MAG TPA: hypothetical protein VEY91_12205 [Candidatus Limnocylindria bacterium]|nr:hypothetical protein [Candidatus Limnocylindria bacterium]
MLVLTGRITDRMGAPVTRARVIPSAGARAGVTADRMGRYVLALPLGTPLDLGQGPIVLSVHAEASGWKLSLPSGDRSLGIELRMVTGLDGITRCMARSNDVRIAATAARLMAANGDTSALVLDFVAEPGDAAAPPSPPVLTQVAQVAMQGIPTPADLPRPPKDASRAAPLEAPRPPARAPAAVAAPREPGPPPADVKRLPDESEKPYRSWWENLWPWSRRDRAAEDRKPEPMAKAEPRPSEPRTAAPAPPSTQPRVAAREPVKPVKSVRPEPRVAAPPRKSQTADTIAHATPPTDRRVIIHPTPQGQSRTRTAPLVIRTPGVRPNAPPPADSCQCRVEGTVEVRSEIPLAARVPVAVSLAWYPAAADTVELFMGSPRPFRLPPAPCGPQRLRVVTLARGGFTVISREAMAGFRCEAGPVRQMRVVLARR